MKSILFIDTGKEYGGGTKSLLYLLDYLSKDKNYNISVFFEHDYDAGNKKISDVIKNLGLTFIKRKKVEISKIKKEILRAVSKESLEKYIFKKECEFAYDLLKDLNVDLVYLNNHFSSNLAYILAANRLKFTVLQHLSKAAKIEDFKLEILKKLDFHTISVSNFIYNFYNIQVKIDKNIIYNPIKINMPNIVKNTQPEISIIMVANFLENKGHNLVFDAFLKLKRNDIKLSLAGNGDFEKNEKFIELKNRGIASYLGFIDNMNNVYPKFDYLLGFSEEEGMPRVVFEALSYGLNVIFSDIGALREIYYIANNKDYIHLINRDSKSLFEFLSILKKPESKNPDLKIINTFSMDNYLLSVEKICKDLM